MDPAAVARLPLSYDSTPLVRTDFSDDGAWERIVAQVTAPIQAGPPDPEVVDDDGTYAANIEPVDDQAFEGAILEDVVAAAEDAPVAGYALLADSRSVQEALDGGAVTVVYLDLTEHEGDDAQLGGFFGRHFRCRTELVGDIEVNLSISNMDFEEFADLADEHGGVLLDFDA